MGKDLAVEQMTLYDGIVSVLLDVAEIETDDVQGQDDMNELASVLFEVLEIEAVEEKVGTFSGKRKILFTATI
jgi:hypothetical protein|tara:strand:- start:624 stop:842 length:219 start_codon:yes stop_codon:yes gene_type:complete